MKKRDLPLICESTSQVFWSGSSQEKTTSWMIIKILCRLFLIRMANIDRWVSPWFVGLFQAKCFFLTGKPFTTKTCSPNRSKRQVHLPCSVARGREGVYDSPRFFFLVRPKGLGFPSCSGVANLCLKASKPFSGFCRDEMLVFCIILWVYTRFSRTPNSFELADIS